MSPTEQVLSAPVAATRAGRTTRWLTTVAVAALCATGLAVTVPASAGAATGAGTLGNGDAIGSVPKVTAVPGGLRFSGWAFDPNAPTSNLPVYAVMDGGRTLASSVTSLPKMKIAKRYGTGPTPAYALTVPVPAGNHIVCAVLGGFGRGLRVAKLCVATPLGRALTSAQIARRSPVGALAAASATTNSVRVAGWTSDPDLVSRRSRVVLYLDGRAVATRVTTKYPSATVPAGAGTASWFDITVPASAGTHLACVWAVNTGLGRNTTFGCRALDGRSASAASTAPPLTPVLNQQVAALATAQRGKPYVWAAAGPKSFDCSGLVMWAYGKYGYRTPRVSQDQIKAARLIPASRAVAGDLVFYHDGVGDVYHVGIYLRPGVSVAAIDTDQGVNYQKIWDPTATYGSFTHR